MSVQALIDQANRKTQAECKRQFERRATDGKVLELMVGHVKNVVEAYRVDPASANCKAAMRELEAYTRLAERRLL